ncbi:hypothetical protein LRS74_33415 [Streptomyces sp. LX-29]|uniref:hypothetical protein n=1 Tax=Streptomyces sp. LX-29 TaxID=2900152 RepID=UPI00240CE622|nr:hypothetical protein [Streptomyces sp. LX-29]WFB11382.1 hypothetical protein LRS74_33415 [Streptomyces sp. LX-29]
MTVVGGLVGADCCRDRDAQRRQDGAAPGREESRSVIDRCGRGNGDRLVLGVLTQYRMAATEQAHRVIAPEVRIEQSRRRLARLRAAG